MSMTTMQQELEQLVDEVAPVFFDRDQLDRLVAEDENPDVFDGECTAHFSCTAIYGL